jgi:hypothetical protein
MIAYMVNRAGKRICHKGHIMTKDKIYTEYRKDGTVQEHCQTCRKEAGQRFKSKNPDYFRDKGKQFRQTGEYERKYVRDRRRYREQWLKYFRIYFGAKPVCSLCRKRLYWTHKEHGKRVCFDHRTGSEPIKSKSPRTWIQNRPCNDENKAIFEKCNFGILCRACNLLLPSDIKSRINMVSNIFGYLQEGLR